MGKGGILSFIRLRRLKVQILPLARNHLPVRSDTSPQKVRGHRLRNTLLLWRSRRDSNSRTAYHRHTISSRARYDRFDTAPCHNCIHNAQYYSRFVFKKQALLKTFFLYFQKFNKFLRISGLFLNNRHDIIYTGFLF